MNRIHTQSINLSKFLSLPVWGSSNVLFHGWELKNLDNDPSVFYDKSSPLEQILISIKLDCTEEGESI
jgi:hypothetical protein